MQDDVSLLKTQLYLGIGRTADARKAADTINLDNPERKQARPLAASIVAEAWARTGKPKEALALLDTIELPAEGRRADRDAGRASRACSRGSPRTSAAAPQTELIALADDDVNHLGRFLDPRFRVHPELQKLARQRPREAIRARAQDGSPGAASLMGALDQPDVRDARQRRAAPRAATRRSRSRASSIAASS